MTIHARVSTDGQTLDAQIAALKAAGATKVLSEKQSGAKDRPCRSVTRLGVSKRWGRADGQTRLDRLARSTCRARTCTDDILQIPRPGPSSNFM
jgi:DNA invertase Pin-like site-specific DNA recombinase